MDIVIFTDVSYALGIGRSAGAYRIATELRTEGYSVQVIDFLTSYTPTQLHKLCKKYITNKTIWVGISTSLIVTDDRYKPWTKYELSPLTEIFQIIKSYKKPLVFGGAGVSKYSDFADFIVKGQGEDTILDLTWKLENGEFPSKIQNEIPYNDFSSSKIIWTDSDFIFPGEHLPIETARGCIFKCSFCSFALNGKKRGDYNKHPLILKEEFLENYNKFGTTGYLVADDTYNDSIEKVTNYHKIITKLPFQLEFSSFARLDVIANNRKMIPLLYESGLRSVFFGIETFHKTAGKYIGKAMDSEKLKDTLFEIRDRCPDMLTTAAFIIGLPGEPWSSIENTIEWLQQEDCPVDSYILNPLIDTGDSKFTNNPEKYGMTYTDSGWEHDIMNEKDAQQFVLNKKINKNYETRNLLGYFSYFSRLRNLGYSIESIKKLKKSDYKEIEKCQIITDSMIDEYYNKLMNI